MQESYKLSRRALNRRIMKKIFSLLLTNLIFTLSLFGQGGSIEISDFLKITKSPLSNISSILLEKKYVLQYIKEPSEEIPANMVDMAWGHNATYIESLDKWEIPKTGGAAYFKILMPKNSHPLIILYCLNNYEAYNQFRKKIVAYGYEKDREEVDIENGCIRFMYDNHTTESTITFEERTQSKKEFAYTIDWFSWKITQYE